MKISAVILAKNEEKNIKECIESLKWTNEIILIDDNSNDQTADLAEKAGILVYRRSLNSDFSSQRNFGLQKASSDWVLFLDADERISPSLQFEIENLISQGEMAEKFDGYFVKRSDFIFGKKLKYGETGNIKLLRLARKASGKWEGKVHERWKIKGKIGYLKNSIIHYPHQSIEEFLKEINFYTDLRAKTLFESGKKANFLSVILYPKTKFFQNFILKRGFLDGIPGLIHALLMSFHSFLVRSKLWQLCSR